MPFEVIDMKSLFVYEEATSKEAVGIAAKGTEEAPQLLDLSGELPGVFDETPESDQKKAASAKEWTKFAGDPSAGHRFMQCTESAHRGTSSSWEDASRVILLNVDGQRLDAILPKWNREIFPKLTKLHETQQFCVDHYLRGQCFKKHCQFRHDPQLGEDGLLVLRHWMRGVPCKYLMECRDPECLKGHICPYGAACAGPSCVFRKTHGLDQTVIKVWPC